MTTEIKKRRGSTNYFAASDIIRFVFDIIRGLEVLHDHGVIHRDLKVFLTVVNGDKFFQSDNVFVTLGSSNEIKYLSIADFDTAKFIHSGNEAKTTLGTPGYMAPEVIKSRGKQQYTFAADRKRFIGLTL